MTRTTYRRATRAVGFFLILSAVTWGSAARAAAPAVSQSSAISAATKQPHNNSDRLVIHEWGTFTSLQNEKGDGIGGINSDDEPVPEFVHRIADFLLLGPRANVPVLYQGAPHCHPDVTMRLETPVVYIYPGQVTTPFSLNVSVAFHGGWLSEYYPDAEVDAPGVTGRTSFGPITRDTMGQLHWNNLRVGTTAEGPKTTWPVWVAPRGVKSAPVTTAKGESEQFLFYRGVGHVDSPLRVSRDDSGQSLTITANFPIFQRVGPNPYIVRSLWLVEIRMDKSCAFRQINGFQAPDDGTSEVVAKSAATFTDSDFNRDNLQKLSAAMRSALIADGLFADEADALLKTWKLSYFESPGMRLFYLLPRTWTDSVLPMKVSRDSDFVRTMVGRVEIVTPAERKLLQQISAGPASDAMFLRRDPRQPLRERPADPADYRAYCQLGRFGNALVLDDLKHNATPTLKKFVDNYGLHSYDPSEK